MHTLLKIFLDIVEKLLKDKTIQQQVFSALQSFLMNFSWYRPKKMAAALSNGEVAELTEDLRIAIAQNAKDAYMATEACHQIQNMFHTSGFNEATVSDAFAKIRDVNNININISLDLKDPRKLRDADLTPLGQIVTAFNDLLRKLDNINDNRSAHDEISKIKAESSNLLNELHKNISNINDVLTILFLSSDPADIDIGKLRLAKEIKEIEDALIYCKGRNNFLIESKGAIELEEVPKYLLNVNPNIVHISGHGEFGGALIFEDESGRSVSVDAETLESIFAVHSEGIHLVIVNACKSSSLAEGISKYIDYTVGMKEEITDDAAIGFSVGFYEAFGAGKGVRKAFDNGCLRIRLKKLQEQHIPQLFVK